MVVRKSVRVRGPLEPYAVGFGAELGRLGYTPLSAASQLRLMAHLSRWLGAQVLDSAGLTPAGVAGFLAARYTGWLSVRGLEPLLGYLCEVGVAPRLVAPVVAPVEVLLERYRGYLLGERGPARTSQQKNVNTSTGAPIARGDNT